MGYSLEQFCADARAALEHDAGPAGRGVLTRALGCAGKGCTRRTARRAALVAGLSGRLPMGI